VDTTQRSGRIRRSEMWLWIIVPAIAVSMVAVQTPITVVIYGVPIAIAFPLTVLHAAALPLALRWPVAAGIVSVLAACTLQWLTPAIPSAPWPWTVTAEIIQFLLVLLLALRAAWQVATVTLLAAVAGSTVIAFARGAGIADAAAVDNVVFVSIGAGVLGIGIAVRQWGGIRAQLVREQRISAEELSRRVVAEERTRLARDLHDVIAHSMSVISVQAASAPARLGGVDPRTADEFSDIAAQARTALREMRVLLGALRDDEAAPVEPQRGLADIAVLVRQTAQAGADVHLDWAGPRAPRLSAVADLAAYRVVQEAVSNALRHAPGAAITVGVDVGGAGVGIRVRNARGSSAATDIAGGGHGLVAMTERVRSAGGIVHAHPTPDGGFEVAAEFEFTEQEEASA
jgi:signal transduction histidine kinase